MSKFLYPIYKLKTKSYIKWWLYHKKAGGSGILSEILEGFSFNLENTLNRKFKLFEIEGNSVQDGSPSPDNEVPILSSGDNGSINEKIKNADGTEEQDYSIFVQQPFRSIGDVRDKFVKVNGNWFERHYIGEKILNGTENWLEYDSNMYLYIEDFILSEGQNNYVPTNYLSDHFTRNSLTNAIANPNASYLIQNVWGDRNKQRGVAIRVNDTFTDLATLKTWLTSHNTKLQYELAEPLDLPCTPEQVEQLENLPSTYKDFTIIQSEDETPAHLKIQYYKEG